MESVILLTMLGVHAAEDIKTRRITLSFLLVFGLAGLAVQLYCRDMDFASIGLGTAVGIGILLLSILTRGSIGMGDGLVFCVTGIYLGGNRNLELLFVSLLYAGLFSLFLLVKGKGAVKKRKKEIPFLPFVFLGYVTIVLEGLL